MNRRTFVGSLTFGLLAAPPAVEAQQPGKVNRIGFLGATSPSGYSAQVFREKPRDLGYVESQNLVIEFRWADGNYARLPDLAHELVRLKPDVLVTHGSAGTLAAKRATSTIPIEMGVTVMRSRPNSSRALRVRAPMSPGPRSFSRNSTPSDWRSSKRPSRV